MPESVTYYHRDGKDYAVLLLEIDELEALLGYIPDHDRMREDYVEALAHLVGRRDRQKARADAIYNEKEDPDDAER